MSETIENDEDLEDDGTNDICPTCNNIYKKCACGHDGDWPNW